MAAVKRDTLIVFLAMLSLEYTYTLTADSIVSAMFDYFRCACLLTTTNCTMHETLGRREQLPTESRYPVPPQPEAAHLEAARLSQHFHWHFGSVQ